MGEKLEIMSEERSIWRLEKEREHNEYFKLLQEKYNYSFHNEFLFFGYSDLFIKLSNIKSFRIILSPICLFNIEIKYLDGHFYILDFDAENHDDAFSIVRDIINYIKLHELL